MAQSLNRNELIHTLITMREQELASFKAYLETADLSLLAGLVQQPPSEEDVGAYKYYIYNNPWQNQVIFKSKHWREWLDKNPIYANIFSEVNVTGGKKPIPIISLPSGINLSTPTWDPASGTPPPPNVDWKAIFTNFKLEVDKLNNRIEFLTLEREQGGKTTTFLIEKNKESLEERDKMHKNTLAELKIAKEAYVNLQKTFAEHSTNLANIEKQQIAQLTKDLSEVNTKYIQEQAASGAKINNLTTEVNVKDQTILNLQNKIDILQLHSGKKDEDMARMEKHYDDIIKNKDALHLIEINTLKANSVELQNKIINLENAVIPWTTDDMTSRGNSGIETVEEMRLALAGLKPWFDNAGLVKTWQFAEDAYKELMDFQSKIVPETAPVDEATVKRKIEWESIKNHFLATLANIDSKISPADDIEKNHNQIMVDDLNNNSNSTLTRLNNLRNYLVNSWPDFLRGKNHNNLVTLWQWEAYEGLSSRTPTPKPAKPIELKPEDIKLPDSGATTPISSGQSTPLIPISWFDAGQINTQPNSDVSTPNLFRDAPEVDEELQNKKDELETFIKSKLFYYSAFSSQEGNTKLPAKFKKKYPSLTMVLSSKLGKDIRWESLLDAINEDSWEIKKGVVEKGENDIIGYKEIEHRLIKFLTEVIIERLIEMNNVTELEEYMLKNNGWIETEVYEHNKSQLNAFLIKDTVAQIRLIVDGLTTKVSGLEKEHYEKMNNLLVSSKVDYYTMLMSFRTFVHQRKNLLENKDLLDKLNHWETVEKVPLTKDKVFDWREVLDDIDKHLNSNEKDGFKEIRQWVKVKWKETGDPIEEKEFDDKIFNDFTKYLEDENMKQFIKQLSKDSKVTETIRFQNYVPLVAVDDENTYLNSLAIFLTGRQDSDPSAGQLYSQQNVATRLRVGLCYILMIDKVLQSRYENNIDKFRGDLMVLARKDYALDDEEKWFDLLALLLKRPIVMIDKNGTYREADSYSGLPIPSNAKTFMIIKSGYNHYAPLVQKVNHNEGIFELKVTNITANDVQNTFVFDFEKPLKKINFASNIEESFISEGFDDASQLRLISGAGNYGKARYEAIKDNLGWMKEGIVAISIGNAITKVNSNNESSENLKFNYINSEIIVQPNCFITARKKEHPSFIYSLAELLINEYPDRNIREMKLDDDFFEKANVYSDAVLDFTPYPNLEKIEYAPNDELKKDLQDQLVAQTKLDERKWDTSWETEKGVRDNLAQLTKKIDDYAEKNKKNRIKRVKISENRQLKEFIFPFAKLNSIFVSEENSKLIKIDVSYNKIIGAGVGWNFTNNHFEGAVNLEELNISHNRLSSILDLKKNKKIKKLDISYNNLETLILFQQPELFEGGLKGLFGTEFNALGRPIQNDSEKKYEKARRGLCPQIEDKLAVAVVDVKAKS